MIKKIDGDKLLLISGDSFLTIADAGVPVINGCKCAGRAGGAIFR